ncbi:MAG: [protein-PII] uridylyltransferase, partial [Pseudomonadota bacterium]
MIEELVFPLAKNKFHQARNDLLDRPPAIGQGCEFASRYTGLMDHQLQALFVRAAGSETGPEGLALAALGGYGRGELAPFSDADLLFLTRPSSGRQNFGPLVEAVLYPLWDMKLDLSHAMRTPAQCLEMAGEDFHTLLTQLDARFLAGDRSVFEELEGKVLHWLGSRDRRKWFFRELRDLVKVRHLKYGQSPYLLEPNVKEGQGALRDIHALRWVGQGLYQIKEIQALARQGILSAERVEELEKAFNFMTDVRLHLHRLSQEKTDTLSFEMQEEIAHRLGYEANGHFSNVERFMQEYYTHVYNTKSTLDYFFSRVQDDLTPGKVWRLTDRTRTVEKGLSIRRGMIELAGSAEVRQRPHLLMRAFEVSSSSGLPVSPRALEITRNNLDLIDEQYRRDPAIARTFLKALAAVPPRTARIPDTLDAMPTLHFLETYIPELAAVRAQVQHDAYHVYTVDVHLVASVWELKKIAMGVTESEMDGLYQKVYGQVGNKELLFLAALLHDIGKGHGRDHACRGAEMVPVIGRRLGLGPEDIDTLTFLVAEHLFLAEIAMRRDLSEEKLIVNVARRVGDVERLNMLYLLTVADSRATGPGAMNKWKATLLRELYSKVWRILTKSELALKEIAQRTETLLREVVGRLEDRLSPEEIDAHLEKMSAYYLSVMDADLVVRHILLERELEDKPLVWEVEAREEGHCEVTILTQDRPGLLSRMAGVFTLHH